MAPISNKFLFFFIKFNFSIEFNEIIVLISFLNFVTSRERSVPPLRIFASGYLFNIFFKLLIVFGAKNFLPLLLISISVLLIFFNNLIVLFCSFLN